MFRESTNLIDHKEMLDEDSVSHKMYMLKRLSVDVDSVKVDAMTVTPFVESKFAA